MQKGFTRYLRLLITGLVAIASSPMLPSKAALEGDLEPSTSSEEQIPKELNKSNPKEFKSTRKHSYILGPGDVIQIELLQLPELSGIYTIGPDGSVYLPRLRAVNVEELTVQELTEKLTEKFKLYVKDPDIYITLTGYRPIRIYVGGEVKRPGFYTLMGTQNIENLPFSETKTKVRLKSNPLNPNFKPLSTDKSNIPNYTESSNLFPTLFDAIRASKGITAYSNLANVSVTRKLSKASGSGRIGTNLNFLSLITKGDDSQNIRLFDGDVVRVAKSDSPLREQLLNASQTNLSPQYLEVFVSGRVYAPGPIVLPQGSSLNKAVLAAAPKLLRGKVEFVRFTRGGGVDRRTFNYKPDAPVEDYRNPVLMSGDIVRVQNSIFTHAMELINEVGAPFLGVYSIYNLFSK